MRKVIPSTAASPKSYPGTQFPPLRPSALPGRSVQIHSGLWRRCCRRDRRVVMDSRRVCRGFRRRRTEAGAGTAGTQAYIVSYPSSLFRYPTPLFLRNPDLFFKIIFDMNEKTGRFRGTALFYADWNEALRVSSPAVERLRTEQPADVVHSVHRQRRTPPLPPRIS